MAEAAWPELRLLDGVSLASSATVGHGGAPAASRSLAFVRAARLIVDHLALEERRRIAAVIACVSGGAEQGAAAAKLAVSALSLGGAVPLHVSGLGGCGLFTALHVGRAVLRGSPDGLVLVVRGEGVSDPHGPGALLLATQGGVACRPLPPSRVDPRANAGPELRDLLYASALALTLSRGSVRNEDVGHAACPGATQPQVEPLLRLAGLQHALGLLVDARVSCAATVEAAIGEAVQAPPSARTLLWARDPDGQLGACVLEPD